MKRILLTLMTLLGVTGMWAQTTADVSGESDILYVVGNSYYVGSETIDIAINIKNDNNMSACTFYVTLPEGLSFIADEDADDDITPLGSADSKHSFTGKINSETNAMIAIVSLSNATFGEEVCKITVAVDQDVIEAGQEYNIVLSTQNLANAATGDDKVEVFHTSDVTSTIIFTDRLVFNETDTELPALPSDKVDVTMNRTIKANQWSTIVLPFTLSMANAKAAFGDDVKLATFDGFEVSYADEEDVSPDAIEIKFKTYTLGARASMAGGTPYLIKTSKDIESFDVDGVTLVSAVKDVTKDTDYSTSGKFTGSFVKTVIPEDGLFISSEKFYYSAGSTNVKAFRAWFELDEVLNKDTDFGAKIGFSVDGDATSVDGLPAVQRIVEGVYDLSGRKIQVENGDVNTLQKGVYIIDGKKVTIK